MQELRDIYLATDSLHGRELEAKILIAEQVHEVAKQLEYLNLTLNKLYMVINPDNAPNTAEMYYKLLGEVQELKEKWEPRRKPNNGPPYVSGDTFVEGDHYAPTD